MNLQQAYEIKELVDNFEKAEDLAIEFQDIIARGHEYIEIKTKHGSMKFNEDDEFGNSIAFHLDTLFGDKVERIKLKIESYEEYESK